MKRILSLSIAAIMFAAALAGCATPTNQIDSNIRLTSSDAADAAEWLEERLDVIPDRIVMGTEAAAYGVDVSGLEDDGYFIRNLGGEVALFAKTPNGLDHAVRKYAKAVEAGSAVEDETFHEGYRVKRIEIAGRDISEYTIYCVDNKYMPSAAAELASRIKEACGASLFVSTEEPKAPYIALRYIHDDTLSTCGYRWNVDENGIVIDCSDGYVITSASFAVARFLEKNLDWFGLSFGFEDLSPAQLISFEVGDSGGEENDFQFAMPYGDFSAAPDVFEHMYIEEKYNLSAIQKACHGLQWYKFAGELSTSPNRDWALDQPCYSDEIFFDFSYEDIVKYIENKLASGAVIGEDFSFIDIAAGDNDSFCGCKACKKLVDEQRSVAAPIVAWANRLSEALNEVYPGLYYGIFAYAGTNRPPKTLAPNEFVYVTFCFDGNCSSHTLDGRYCTQGESIVAGLDNSTPLSHYLEYSEFIEGWMSLTKNVYVWYYALFNGFSTMSFVHNIRDDLLYLHRIGVKGFFYQSEDNGYCTGKVEKWLAMELVWNISMDDEEYDELYDRVLKVLYGEDAAPYIREYITLTDEVYQNGACMTCWGLYWQSHMALPLYAKMFDTLFDLIETSIPLAETERQEYRMIKLSVECIYKGCSASYFTAYNAGDDERVAELCRRYALIDERLTSLGIDMTKLIYKYDLLVPSRGYERDLELEAWSEVARWKKYKMTLSDFIVILPTREMPDHIAEILEEKGLL